MLDIVVLYCKLFRQKLELVSHFIWGPEVVRHKVLMSRWKY